jgi:hypothetical protein
MMRPFIKSNKGGYRRRDEALKPLGFNAPRGYFLAGGAAV